MRFEDNYVVRIYRREPSASAGQKAQDPVTLIGMVENANTGVHRAFHCIEELWSALLEADTDRAEAMPPRSAKNGISGQS